MKQKFKELSSSKQTAHIYYATQKQENYLENLAAYIIAGIEQGDHIILIENDRIYSLLQQKISASLSQEDWKKIYPINNFDYYFSSGSFHPPHIFAYLDRVLKPYLEQNLSFRIWAHVEWNKEEEVLHILKEFEHEADRLVTENKLMLVCAYNKERVPASLDQSLMECHEYILTENEIILSEAYLYKK